MEGKMREYFHLLWLVAIVLCTLAAVFALLFASCSRGPSSAGDAAPASVTAPAEDVPAADLPADSPAG